VSFDTHATSASHLTMSLPVISLIIPTHLRPVLLKRALESINAQTQRSQVEVIVVSDAADQGTDQVCAELLGKGDIYVRRNGTAGPSASRNLGLKLANGRFVMFLDDDDAWQPVFLPTLFEKLPLINGSVSYFNCTVIKESRPPSGPILLGEIALDLSQTLSQEVFIKNQVHMSCFLFSRHLLAGLEFDTTMRGYEDWDYLLAVLEREMAVHLPIPCSYVHEVDDATTDRRGSSSGAKGSNAILDYLYVYRRHAAPSLDIQRKRKEFLDAVNLSLHQELL
jgi:GalNAc5-diNAcBac-PP-undecaprenol beta-1,3-glucosyltransferase